MFLMIFRNLLQGFKLEYRREYCIIKYVLCDIIKKKKLKHVQPFIPFRSKELIKTIKAY